MSGPRVEVGVLGTSTLVVDGVSAPLNARRMRGLLAALVLGPGPRVAADRLVLALWGHEPPAVANNTLQGYISRMRRLVETRPGARTIEHSAGGYLLTLGSGGKVDVHGFDHAVTAAQAFLRVLPDPSRPQVADQFDRVEVQRERLDRALATWRGEPYSDLADDDIALAERRRLVERRIDGQTALLVMDLMLGRAGEAAAGLEELVDAHPLREQLWRLWAVALVRSDRQAHALEALANLRSLLTSELGIDPSPAVAQLHRDILRQDPSVLGDRAVSALRSASAAEPSHPPATTYRSSMLGREREARLLRAAVVAATDGRGRHAVVVAEPGMGKSRLVDEVLGEARRDHDLTVVSIRGTGRVPVPPLWSLNRAVADLSTQSGLEPPAELRDPSTIASFEHAAAFADFVRRVTSVRPVVLVAEDLHRLDGPTLSALTHLVEEVAEAPLMLLVTRRPGAHDGSDDLAVAIARTGGLWLELEGLDTRGTRLLVDAFSPGRPGTDSDVDRLRNRSGGNPLHLLALFDEASDEVVPPALVALVRAELLDLPPGVAAMLRNAATYGPRFPDALHSPGEAFRADDGLEAARRAGLVRKADDAWEFASPIIHEAVLTLLGRPPTASRPRVVASSDGPEPTAPRAGRLALVSGPRYP